ncbi:VOC family protein [Nocardia sp. NPDC057353]|uniref:VOC family protein n=1 Tax=Nocardia sp. NPDC057353 TaxID=3346104 RepID=UPI00362F9214
MSENTVGVWPCLSFRDAAKTTEFLVRAFGFRKVAEYTRENDPAIVEHGELRWPAGGGIMYGTANKSDDPFCTRATGNDNIYLVTDEPDALFERATAAGAELVRGLRDEDYGSRGFTVRDPEGNLWSFGTYRGE